MMRFSVFALLIACSGPKTGPSPTADVGGSTSTSGVDDHALTRIKPPVLMHGAEVENAWNSPESAQDKIVMQALEGLKHGEDLATSCKLGGKCGVDLTELRCDRKAMTCLAKSWAEPGSEPPTLSATEDAARKIIDTLSQLDKLPTVRPRCDADGCKLAAISCFSDRHDEKGFGGADVDKGSVYTCDDSRRK
jgi:hypothetical protein